MGPNIKLSALLAATLLWACDEGSSSQADANTSSEADKGPVMDATVDATVEATADAAVDAEVPITDASEPSPRARLLINEVMLDPADGAEDWVELVALGEGTVDPTLYTLVDANPDHAPEALEGAPLSAGDFLVVAVVRDGMGAGLSFGLGATDGLTLAREGEVVDTLTWVDGDAPRGASYGRVPDGLGEAQTLSPSPGAPNRPYEGPPLRFDPFPDDRVIEVRLEVAPGDWQAILAAPLDETYYPGEMLYDGVRTQDVAIRVKGNSSLQSVVRSRGDRFSFKVDMNRYVDGQDFAGMSKLNFNNGYHDPSMMRERLAYEAAASLGLPVVRTAHVDLWLNEEHMGLYTVVEHVDGEFLKRWFGDDGGLLYKPSGSAGALTYEGDDPSRYQGMDPQRGDDEADHSAFLELAASIARRPGARPFEEIFDVDGGLRYLASVVAYSTLDSYIGPAHNYYLYELEGRFTIIPWDFNGAFGIFTCNCDHAGIIGFRIDEPVCSALADRPLVGRLLEDEANLATYHSYLSELIEGPLSPEFLRARTEQLGDLIEPYVVADERAFYSPAEFRDNLSNDHVEMGGRVLPGLLAFARDRGAHIWAQLAWEEPSTNEGRGNCPRRGRP